MSSCYKCGRDLTEGQVECEPFCTADEVNPVNFKNEAAELQAEANLAQELQSSAENSLALAKHLDAMGASAAKLIVEYEGRRFLVFVKEL